MIGFVKCQFAFVLVVLYFSCLQTQAADLKISTYYESLCPDSIHFVVTQLWPNYKLFGNVLELDWIPFGNAKAIDNNDGTWNFTCQHGPNECHGNLYHSCAVEIGSIEESSQFIYCSMSSASPSSDEVLEQCSKDAGISWTDLTKCFESGQAAKLLVQFGKRTNAVTPKITWIPTIIFNNKFNQTLLDEAQVNLLGVICDLLPNPPEALYSQQVAIPVVRIGVVYDSRCPGSRDFIINQLWPVYNIIGKDNLKINMYPFGSSALRASYNGTLSVFCPRERRDSLANEYHACALGKCRPYRALKFIYCQMRDRLDTVTAMMKCAEEAKLDWSRLEKCVKSGDGEELMLESASYALGFEPEIVWLPTIYFNDHYFQQYHDIAIRDLLKVVCIFMLHIPQICKHYIASTPIPKIMDFRS